MSLSPVLELVLGQNQILKQELAGEVTREQLHVVKCTDCHEHKVMMEFMNSNRKSCKFPLRLPPFK